MRDAHTESQHDAPAGTREDEQARTVTEFACRKYTGTSQHHKVTSASRYILETRQTPHLAASVGLAQNICLPKESACRAGQASSLAISCMQGSQGIVSAQETACRGLMTTWTCVQGTSRILPDHMFHRGNATYGRHACTSWEGGLQEGRVPMCVD